MFKRDLDLEKRWGRLLEGLQETIGKKPNDLNGVLFLIGIQELGQGTRPFTKEQKQDLMHVAVCCLLMQSGYYELEGFDAEQWPHFRQLKPLPELMGKEQEDFIKDHGLLYFDKQEF